MKYLMNVQMFMNDWRLVPRSILTMQVPEASEMTLVRYHQRALKISLKKFHLEERSYTL